MKKYITIEVDEKTFKRWTLLKSIFSREDEYVFRYCVKLALEVVQALQAGYNVGILDTRPGIGLQNIVKRIFPLRGIKK